MKKISDKKNNIKKIRSIAFMAVLSALLAAGCGKKQDKTNLSAGMELVENYDFQAAVESFELALLNNEDKELAYRGQGIAYMGLGMYEEAQTAFLKSIENAGNNLTDLQFDTNYYLASAYMKQGKYEAAEEIYSAIIALRKKDKDAYYLRACALLRRKSADNMCYEKAVADFEKAFSLDSKNLSLRTDAYVEMKAAGFGEEGKVYLKSFMEEKDKNLNEGEKGVLYYYLEDYENARIFLDASVNGNDPELSLILGQTYEQLGDMNYASVVYQTYLQSNTPNAALYNNLGMCLMRQQKYEDALNAFQSGIDIGSSDYLQELQYNRIIANEYLGRFGEAKSMMQEYIQIYPDDDAAKKENDFLQTR